MNGRNYIGLATTQHDSAIAIVDGSGQLLFAESTERYMQSKRAVNMVPDPLLRTSKLMSEFCDPQAELVAGFSWNAAMVERNVRSLQSLDGLLASWQGPEFVERRLRSGRFFLRSHIRMDRLSGAGLEVEWERCRNAPGQVIRRRYDHHRTHAANAFFSSPFEQAVCAIVDGYGEDAGYAFYHCVDGRLEEIPTALTPARGPTGSLGRFYEDLCTACGFDSAAGEEWKVMGLAAYGHHDEQLYALLRPMVRVDGLDIRAVTPAAQLETWSALHRIERRAGAPALSAANLAFTGQKVFCEVLYELLCNLHGLGLSENLVYGGGCALNSAANGGILQQTPFKKLHVPSAPGDDGNAIGAALLAYQDDHPLRRPWSQSRSAYLGSELSRETQHNVQRFSGIQKLTQCSADAPERAASLLAQGKIVGWIQGRAEFGPRALGNRSILADPRCAKVKDRLNATVKFREEFRPFAPSILHEFGDQYFEHYQESRYMERTLKFRAEVRARVPGVVHVDGTGRLQTVVPAWNERYYRLIRCFFDITDIPLVLNTSYNVMGKPIAHSVEDVLAVFYTSGLDAVFIGDLLIEK